MMKAIVKSKPVKGLWMEEIDVSEPGFGEVLIKVKKASICGTDKHIFDWDDWSKKTIPIPLVIGHEFVGSIAKLGERVENFNVGDRVSAEGHIVCYSCSNCRSGNYHLCPNTQGIGVNRPGAFAEFVCVPASNVIKIPNGISDDTATLLDPLGNAVHAALSYDLIGEDVLVAGAGPIGIMAALICQMVGARNVVLTEINPYRLKLAKEVGVRNVVDVGNNCLSTVMQNFSITEGFGVSLEMSGSPTAMRTIVDTSKNGGKIAVLGIASTNLVVPWDTVVFKMLNIKGIYGREMFNTWQKMMSLLEGGLDVSGLITHRIPFDEFEIGFNAIESGSAGKVILELD